MAKPNNSSINGDSTYCGISFSHPQIWVYAIALTLALNLALYLILPILVDTSSKPSNITSLIERVDVIRIKKKELPPEKKKKKPEEKKEKPKPKELVKAKVPVPKKKLVLPFKLNTRLPTVSTDFQLPMEQYSFSALLPDNVNADQLDGPLTPVARIPPIYPARARRRGIEGWVNVSFVVGAQGNVRNIKVLDAEPEGMFERSVVKCLAKWRFRPGTVEGVPVSAKMITTIRFELE